MARKIAFSDRSILQTADSPARPGSCIDPSARDLPVALHKHSTTRGNLRNREVMQNRPPYLGLLICKWNPAGNPGTYEFAAGACAGRASHSLVAPLMARGALDEKIWRTGNRVVVTD